MFEIKKCILTTNLNLLVFYFFNETLFINKLFIDLF